MSSPRPRFRLRIHALSPRARRRASACLALACVLGTSGALGRGIDDGAHALPPAFARALAQAGVPRDAVSVEVSLLSDGPGSPGGLSGAPPRLAWRARAPMNPASVMKLVTTYAGLDLLGPDFTWTNRVDVGGPVRDGVLDGDLLIRGSGDPKLVLERLDALLRQVMARGVREVRGDIVLDGSVFTVPEHDPAAFDAEPLRPYNAAPEGLLVNFKSLIFTFTPDPASGQARVTTEPPIAGVDLPVALPLREGPCGDWRGALQPDFSSPDRVRFDGRYPTTCGERVWPVAYVAPREYAPRVVRALWTGAGGVLGGQVREARPQEAALTRAQPLLSAASLPLADIVADINKFSNNVMAQQLFLTLSSQSEGRGSFEGSRSRLMRWWRERFGASSGADRRSGSRVPRDSGIDEPVIDNGSGLSRQERISAAALTALLRRAAASPLATPFTRSLGIAGVDGTVARLAERRPDSPALGRAWLKTGSLRDVAALAGYVQGRSGRRYSVVALINHSRAPATRAALDELLDWVAREDTD